MLSQTLDERAESNQGEHIDKEAEAKE